ncbi:hypothetical protein VKT23_006768 [Stygiomarasmius scandens]|uniref:ABM domain-containing protein n=1 Tax=Marasmiellus scandens TaxID=2682957 RepID=A0ABR1JKR7_9AGAR
MPDISDIPETTPSGKLIIIATLKVKPGNEDRIKEILQGAKKDANSDKEPKTLSYRTALSVSSSGQHQSEFVVVEEYLGGRAGVMEHGAQAGSQALLKAREEGVFEEFDLKFYDEF